MLATVIVSLPFVEFSRFNGNLDAIPWATLRDALPQGAVRIQKITINRSAYLYGLFSLIGYGLFRAEVRPWVARAAGVVGLLSFVLALGTASRAAAVFPIAVLIVSELCWRYRHWVAQRARSLSVLVVLCSLVFNLVLYWPSSPVAAGDPADVGRANIAQCFVGQAVRSLPDLLTGQGYDRVSDHCAARVFLPGRSKGFPMPTTSFCMRWPTRAW